MLCYIYIAIFTSFCGNNLHCVKIVQIRSFFWSVFSCIQSECRKIRNRKTPYLDTFHAVLATNCLSVFDHFVGLVLKGLMWSFSELFHFFCSIPITITPVLPIKFNHEALFLCICKYQVLIVKCIIFKEKFYQ